MSLNRNHIVVHGLAAVHDAQLGVGEALGELGGMDSIFEISSVIREY